MWYEPDEHVLQGLIVLRVKQRIAPILLPVAFFIVQLVVTSWAQDSAPAIHTVLPKDAIPAILNPEFVNASEARVENESAMIGVVFNDQAHAYSSTLLNTHEIVNDVVDGKAIATTW